MLHFVHRNPLRRPAWTTPTHGPSPLLPTLACMRRRCAICFSWRTLGSPDRSPGGPLYRGTSGTSAALFILQYSQHPLPGPPSYRRTLRIFGVGLFYRLALATSAGAFLSCHVCNVVPQACRFRAGFVPAVWVLAPTTSHSIHRADSWKISGQIEIARPSDG
jgi:hypothetical protein